MYIQDWLTLKVVRCPDVIVKNLNSGDKIVYKKDDKKFIGTYIGYECKTDFEGNFLYKLDGANLEKFLQGDKKAKTIFENIKDELKIIFPQLKFITAKINYEQDVLYIYFYGETRVDFRPFLAELRNLIGMKFFLYQVGARDRVRLHPNSCNMIGDCGHKLCCTKTYCKLDSVETSTVHLQNLQTQGVDKQKGVCGKLKCCLKYEEPLYISEQKKYPDIGTELEKGGKKYTVIGINIISEYIFAKDEDGYITKFALGDF